MTNADKYAGVILLALLRRPNLMEQGLDCYLHQFRRNLPHVKVKRCKQFTSCEKCRAESIAWLEGEARE